MNKGQGQCTWWSHTHTTRLVPERRKLISWWVCVFAR